MLNNKEIHQKTHEVINEHHQHKNHKDTFDIENKNCFLFMSRRKVFNQKGTYIFQKYKHLLLFPS